MCPLFKVTLDVSPIWGMLDWLFFHRIFYTPSLSLFSLLLWLSLFAYHISFISLSLSLSLSFSFSLSFSPSTLLSLYLYLSSPPLLLGIYWCFCPYFIWYDEDAPAKFKLKKNTTTKLIKVQWVCFCYVPIYKSNQKNLSKIYLLSSKPQMLISNLWIIMFYTMYTKYK